MSNLTLPTGILPTLPVDPITSDRAANWRIDLLDNAMAPAGELDGVEGGDVSLTFYASIKGRAEIQLRDLGDGAPNWYLTRVAPKYLLAGQEWPWGVYVASTPVESWDDDGRYWKVELLDITSRLKTQAFTKTYALDAGTNVTDAVRTIIALGGEIAGSVTDSTETLRSAKAWPAGTPYLTVINELLAAAGFFSLRNDRAGAFHVEKATRPAERPVAFEFVDDDNSIYVGRFDVVNDIYSVPNRVVATSTATGDTEALTSTYSNTDPDSQFSFAARGERWFDEVRDGVDVTSQGELDAYARQALITMSSVAKGVAIGHAPIELDAGSVVRFRSLKAGIDGLFVVTKTTLPINAEALQTTELQEVVDL